MTPTEQLIKENWIDRIWKAYLKQKNLPGSDKAIDLANPREIVRGYSDTPVKASSKTTPEYSGTATPKS